MILVTKKIFLQLPEGLKKKATSIADGLEAKGDEVIISGDPCYGACDLRFMQGFETLHYGHSKMLDTPNVTYEPYRAEKELVSITLKALPLLPERVALASTIQHSNRLSEAKDALEEKGKKVMLVPKGERCSEDGQVLGCDVTGAIKVKDSVDAFLFIGTGLFHPMGLTFYTRKPVVRADPYTGDVEALEPHAWAKESALRQTKASNAKRYGIILSTKPGQSNPEKAKELKHKLEEKGFKAYIIAMDEVTPDRLLGFEVDVFVITACPRIVIDDWKNYDKAVLLPEEAEL